MNEPLNLPIHAFLIKNANNKVFIAWKHDSSDIRIEPVPLTWRPFPIERRFSHTTVAFHPAKRAWLPRSEFMPTDDH